VKDPDYNDLSDARLEALVISEYATPPERGAAKAELVRRQRQHEIKLAEAEDTRETNRRNFDERMSREQQAHAERIASQQLQPAKSSVSATRLAALAALLSTAAALASAGIGYMAYADQHRQQTLAAHPLVDFYTEDSDSEPTVGVQILNEGLYPLIVAKLEYFVDGRRIRDTDEANHLAKLADPDKVQVMEFGHNNPLGVGEKVWLYSRDTSDKAELAKFVSFIDDHFAVGVRVCSQFGQCTSPCSTTGKCGPKYPD
jgi:hypothetical protein